ncbi:MAG TPA: ABC transporter permease [Thermomicrobiales bacterium]|nr:ABC transporter permease [Thermomicrobiales bacterium]
MQYLARRVGFYLIAAWASITLNFFLPRMMPGDPADIVFARAQGRMTPESLQAMKKAYGLSDAPLIVQYWDYIKAVLSGNLGTSFLYFPTPVSEVIGTGLRWTLLLGLTSVILAFIFGSLIGILGAWRRGGTLDSALPPLLLFIGSFPYFWLATIVLYLLAFRTDLFPIRHAYQDGMIPSWDWDFIKSVIYHLILPATTVLVVSIGGWVLGMRNAMISTLAEDYVTMAEAKGLSERRVMFAYAARNAVLPNVTAFGMALGFVLSGSLLTEVVFAYPGLGYQLLNAVRGLDYPLMQGLFLMITFAVLGANLLVDLLYIRLDPRVRRR